MCDQQRLRSACAYAQSDLSLCSSVEYSMTAKLLTEDNLKSLSLKGGYKGTFESTLVKMAHCWKSHVVAHMSFMSDMNILIIYKRLTIIAIAAHPGYMIQIEDRMNAHICLNE